MSKLFAVIGHSGSGKTTTMRVALGDDREVVSVTTRPMRDGEVNGKDYHFITSDDFFKLLNQEKLAEKTTYYASAYYGATKEEIENKLSLGNAFIVVDYHGYQQLKDIYGNRVVSIFMYTDKDEAEKRMKLRGDKNDSVEVRLSTYEAELINKNYCDYVIKNIDFDHTVQILKNIALSYNK